VLHHVAEQGPKDFPDLLLKPGMGARTVRALAMVADVVHGAPYRFSDPARFSLAHGVKDRHPFAVPLKIYDETISVPKSPSARQSCAARRRASGYSARLDEQARKVEAMARGPSKRSHERAPLSTSNGRL
jgi:hypothetical protein